MEILLQDALAVTKLFSVLNWGEKKYFILLIFGPQSKEIRKDQSNRIITEKW